MDRYGLTKEHVDDLVSPGTLRKGLWRVPDIDMTDYDRYTVTQVDVMRIDLIAFKMYEDVTLWWVIAVMNNIANPFRDLTPGTMLKIPKIEAITAAMLKGSTA